MNQLAMLTIQSALESHQFSGKSARHSLARLGVTNSSVFSLLSEIDPLILLWNETKWEFVFEVADL